MQRVYDVTSIHTYTYEHGRHGMPGNEASHPVIIIIKIFVFIQTTSLRLTLYSCLGSETLPQSDQILYPQRLSWLFACERPLSLAKSLIFKTLLYMVTSYCALWRKDSLCTLVCGFYVSRKGGTRVGGCDHPQGAVHMVAAMLGYKRTMVGTEWTSSHPRCMDRSRKHYSNLYGVSALVYIFQSTIACALISGRHCLLMEAQSAIEFSFGVRTQTEVKIPCVKGKHLLKVVYT